MGIQAGSGRALRKADEKTSTLTAWAGLAAMLFLASCAGAPRSSGGNGGWKRSIEDTPQLLARCFYGPREVTDALVTEMEDVAVPARRWARFGNGMISLRVENGQGRMLPALECGGHLVVVGDAGQSWRLWVSNETDVPIEVLPMVDGLDLESGGPADLARSGRVLPPRQKTVFTTMAGEGGKAAPLTFREVADTQALHRITPTGTAGSVVVAVFLPAGRDSFDSRPLLERRLPPLHSGGGTTPRRRYEPMLLPYQYR